MSYHDKHLDELTGRIVSLMEAGDLPPWMKGWEPGHAPSGPWNPATGKQYSAENALILMLAQAERNLGESSWMTYKQAAAVGGQVAKGADGVRIKVFVPKTEQEKGAISAKDPQGYLGPTIKYAWVFPTSDIRGLPKDMLEPKCTLNDIERHEACDKLLADSGVKILHDRNQAFYQPSTDTIHLPPRNSFKSADHYYSMALHELAHSSGAPSRLNRESLTGALWGTPEYAREELVAEVASYFLGSRLGVGHDPENHAAYMKFWIDELKGDNRLLSKAASQAEQICQYLGVRAEQTTALPQIERSRRQESEQGTDQSAGRTAEQSQAPADPPAGTKARAPRQRARAPQEQGASL